MLKRRIARWGLGRNQNEAVVAEALRIAIQRETQSKKTAFIIGNRTVTRKEIDRYLQRKGICDAHSFITNSHRKAPTSAIIPYTPPQTPPPPDAFNRSNLVRPVDDAYHENDTSASQSQFSVFATAEALITTLSGSYQLQTPLGGPPELELLRKAFLSNDAYYRSIYAFGTFTTSNMTVSEADERLDIFTSGMWRGRDLLIEGEFESAFKCFNEAFGSINAITVQHSRRFLPELFEMFLNFQLEERFDILQSLLNFISQICNISGNRNAWLLQIIEPLLQLNRADRIDVVERLMQNVVSHFKRNVGEDHPETKSILKALSRSAFRRKPVSQAIGHLQAILQDDQAIASMSIYENCNLLVELALCHRVQNRFDDSVDWAQQAWKQADILDSVFHQTDIKVRCLRVMSYVEKKRGNWQAAYDLGKEAVKISSIGLGSEDSLTALVRVESTDLQNQAMASGAELFLGEMPQSSNHLVDNRELDLMEQCANQSEPGITLMAPSPGVLSWGYSTN